MQIDRVEVREINMSRRVPFSSSRATVAERRILIVTVFDRDGRAGWGECSAPEEPRYCEEWTEGAWDVINQVLVPTLLRKRPEVPGKIQADFSLYRGNRMAKAAIENACWDLEARCQGEPLWRLLGGSDAPIPCGVALGIMESVAELLSAIEREVAAGYRRIKLKIQPGWDTHILEIVRHNFPDIILMVDANGAYEARHINVLKAMDKFNLLMIEQPFAPDDLAAFRAIRNEIRTPVCMDESIVSTASTRAALEFDLCDMVNVKLGRVGGHIEAKEIVTLCQDHDVPSWCGGQHEAGLGRAHNIALAALNTREIPSELSASARYWDRDIIQPEIHVTPQGFLRPPTGPGIGFDVDQSYIQSLGRRNQVHR